MQTVICHSGAYNMPAVVAGTKENYKNDRSKKLLQKEDVKNYEKDIVVTNSAICSPFYCAALFST